MLGSRKFGQQPYQFGAPTLHHDEPGSLRFRKLAFSALGFEKIGHLIENLDLCDPELAQIVYRHRLHLRAFHRPAPSSWVLGEKRTVGT